MTQQKIEIGLGDAKESSKRFISAWHRAVSGEAIDTEVHLNFESLATLVSVLTPKRLELLQALRTYGPLSIRALSKRLERDYKNVHVDTTALEAVGLIQRDEGGLVAVPWDVIDAQFRLVA
jgi:predicted transcriptional regulator